jgi:predicted small metal-binding protein
MRKELACGRVVPGCDFVAHASSDEELMLKAAEHARNVHGVSHMSEDLKAKIKDAIVDVDR